MASALPAEALATTTGLAANGARKASDHHRQTRSDSSAKAPSSRQPSTTRAFARSTASS